MKFGWHKITLNKSTYHSSFLLEMLPQKIKLHSEMMIPWWWLNPSKVSDTDKDLHQMFSKCTCNRTYCLQMLHLKIEHNKCYTNKRYLLGPPSCHRCSCEPLFDSLFRMVSKIPVWSTMVTCVGGGCCLAVLMFLAI